MGGLGDSKSTFLGGRRGRRARDRIAHINGRQPHAQTYDIHFKDTSTGAALPDVIKETSGSFVWGADASTVYYEKMDAAHRYGRKAGPPGLDATERKTG